MLLHYITLHYMLLHYIVLEYITLTYIVLHDIMYLGLAPNWKKVIWDPVQRLKFLGFIVDSVQMRFFVAPRIHSFQRSFRTASDNRSMASETAHPVHLYGHCRYPPDFNNEPSGGTYVRFSEMNPSLSLSSNSLSPSFSSYLKHRNYVVDLWL